MLSPAIVYALGIRILREEKI